MIYMLLVKQDAEWSGSNTWWLKGEYEAESPEDAVRQAYADTYFGLSRAGRARRRDRVAATGPGTVWQEYEVLLETHAAEIVSIEEKVHQRDEG